MFKLTEAYPEHFEHLYILFECKLNLQHIYNINILINMTYNTYFVILKLKIFLSSPHNIFIYLFEILRYNYTPSFLYNQ
jgi:hypothetical protein